MNDEPRIYMKHIRMAKMCSKGTRAFFQKHGIDWIEFLKNGVPASVLVETKDAMALRVVEVACGRKL